MPYSRNVWQWGSLGCGVAYNQVKYGICVAFTVAMDGCRCMYISGMPGTGKTATVLEVVHELQQCIVSERGGDVPVFRFIHLNGLNLTNPQQVFQVILKVCEYCRDSLNALLLVAIILHCMSLMVKSMCMCVCLCVCVGVYAHV